MLEKIRNKWESLDQDLVVNKRELVLGIAACTLAGVLAGMLLSPNKSITIGSHNRIAADPASEDDEDSEAASASEEDEG